MIVFTFRISIHSSKINFMKLLDLLTPAGFHIHVNPIHIIHVQSSSATNTIIHFASSSNTKDGLAPYSIIVKHTLSEVLDKLSKF